jgi:sugar phosphate isomerase/epimerase
MRLGICTAPEKAQLVKKAGFDYYEFQMFQVHDAPDEQYNKWLDLQQEAGILCEAMNCMLHQRYQVTGPKADLGAIKLYLEKVIPRCSGMGTKTIVFGSAWSRNMPEGFSDRQKAYEQIVEYLRLASDICGEHGITIAIEPLGAPVTNIVSFVAEGNYLCCLVDRDNVRLLADLYALSQNHENCQEALVGYAPRMEHLHFCAFNRKYPRRDDGCDYSDFFNGVKRSGFDKRANARISVEANHIGDEYEDMAEAMAVFRKYL